MKKIGNGNVEIVTRNVNANGNASRGARAVILTDLESWRKMTRVQPKKKKLNTNQKVT